MGTRRRPRVAPVRKGELLVVEVDSGETALFDERHDGVDVAAAGVGIGQDRRHLASRKRVDDRRDHRHTRRGG